MRRTLRLIPLLFAVSALLPAWAPPPIVGQWDVTADDPSGGESKWTLTVTEEAGKLSGSLAGDPGAFPLTDPTFEDGAFRFRLEVGGQVYSVRLKVQGAKCEGGWEADGATGKIRGEKIA